MFICGIILAEELKRFHCRQKIRINEIAGIKEDTRMCNEDIRKVLDSFSKVKNQERN